MKVSVYLHRDIYDMLTSFGTLDDVVNKILDLGDSNVIDIMDKPECGSRDGASRYIVNIENQNYIYMQNELGVTSKRCSLRRLLYWFVNEQIYSELGWTVRKLNNMYNDRVIKSLNNIIDESYKIRRYLKGYDTELAKIAELVTKIRSDIKNGEFTG